MASTVRRPGRVRKVCRSLNTGVLHLWPKQRQVVEWLLRENAREYRIVDTSDGDAPTFSAGPVMSQLALPFGFGKTITALAFAQKIAGQTDGGRVLIVTPHTLFEQWVSEATRFYSNEMLERCSFVASLVDIPYHPEEAQRYRLFPGEFPLDRTTFVTPGGCPVREIPTRRRRVWKDSRLTDYDFSFIEASRVVFVNVRCLSESDSTRLRLSHSLMDFLRKLTFNAIIMDEIVVNDVGQFVNDYQKPQIYNMHPLKTRQFVLLSATEETPYVLPNIEHFLIHQKTAGRITLESLNNSNDDYEFSSPESDAPALTADTPNANLRVESETILFTRFVMDLALASVDTQKALALLPSACQLDFFGAKVEALRNQLEYAQQILQENPQNDLKTEVDALTVKLGAIEHRCANDTCIVCFEDACFSSDAFKTECCSKIICNNCIVNLGGLPCPNCVDSQVVLPGTAADADYILPFKLAFKKLADRCLFETKTLVVYDAGARGEVAQSLLKKHLTDIFHGSFLEGNSRTISNLVKEFRENSSLNCLYVNARIVNSGLNLEFVQNIVFIHAIDTTSATYQQILGRLRRPGRTTHIREFFVVPACPIIDTPPTSDFCSD